MTQINKTKKELKRSALFYFNNDIISEIGNALMKSFGFRHQSIETLHVNIGKLQKIIENEKEIDNELMPILKTALVYYRQSVAEDVARKSALTYNDEVRSVLDAKLSVFSELFGEEWFDTTPLTDDFEITNFVSIQHAVKLIPHAKMKERKYDEKFHILNAPELFFDDLSYFRFQCRLRKKHVCVAYIDIDNFKDFNSNYGETQVDKEILPRFMSEIDAFLYHHGFAYRYGGDEYIVIIPNMGLQKSVAFLKELQNDIGELDFYKIDDKIQVSIGLVEVSKETYLTDQEIEERAEFAKNYAKGNGKNCIAIFNSHLMKDNELEIAD